MLITECKLPPKYGFVEDEIDGERVYVETPQHIQERMQKENLQNIQESMKDIIIAMCS